MGVSIIADSASDVSQATAKEWDITILPLKIRFGEEEFLDAVTITNEKFYERLTGGEIPKTSQITPADYEECFKKETDKGNEVVCLTISSGVSGTNQSANIAASEFDGKVHVVDSKQFCISYYILVEYAVRLRNEGKSASEIAAAVDALTSKATVLSIFDTLEYLKKGGRLSSTSAFVGEVLSIKPAITITNGVVEVFGKVRGAKKGIATIISKVEEMGGIDFSMPFCVGSTGGCDNLLEKFLEEGKHLFNCELSEIKRISVGATIGTYAGPGAFAIAFYPKG